MLYMVAPCTKLDRVGVAGFAPAWAPGLTVLPTSSQGWRVCCFATLRWCEGRVRVELTVGVVQAPLPYHLATGPRFLTVQTVSDEALSGPSFFMQLPSSRA